MQHNPRCNSIKSAVQCWCYFREWINRYFILCFALLYLLLCLKAAGSHLHSKFVNNQYYSNHCITILLHVSLHRIGDIFATRKIKFTNPIEKILRLFTKSSKEQKRTTQIWWVAPFCYNFTWSTIPLFSSAKQANQDMLTNNPRVHVSFLGCWMYVSCILWELLFNQYRRLSVYCFV